MIQVHILWFQNQGTLNEILRDYPREYPKREIISVSAVPAEPAGWFATITYKLSGV